MKKRLSTNNIGEEAYNRRIHETVGLQGGNAMDLRIEKTEKGIRNAFIELRSSKPLEKITIKELCEHAYINKSTFYSHYKDIYDLSERMEEEVSHPLPIVSRIQNILWRIRQNSPGNYFWPICPRIR